MFFSFPRTLGSLGSAGAFVAGKKKYPMGRFSGSTSRGGRGRRCGQAGAHAAIPIPLEGARRSAVPRAAGTGEPSSGKELQQNLPLIACHCVCHCLSSIAGAWMSRELLSRLGMFQRLLLLILPGKARGSRVLWGSSIHPFPAKLQPAAQGAPLGPHTAFLLLFSLSPYALAPNLHQPEARKGCEDHLVPIQANVLSHLGDHPSLQLARVRLVQLQCHQAGNVSTSSVKTGTNKRWPQLWVRRQPGKGWGAPRVGERRLDAWPSPTGSTV